MIMNEQAEFEKMLKLLMLLSNDIGYNAEQLSEMFDTPTRNIYKYIKIFKDAGFIVSTRDNKYFVDKKSPYYKEISKLLHFSEEEAFILSKAIHSIDNENIIKDNLIKKLYSLYDFERVAETIVKKENSENVHQLLTAIKSKNQVILKAYKSSHSSEITDRLVEPFDFTANYISLWAYEPSSGKVKLYKISRIGAIKNLEKKWENEGKHQKDYIDVFRISSKEQITVKIQLNLRSHNLLVEEYPLAEKFIDKTSDDSYLFNGWVCSFYGIGRFILGLPDEIKIIEPQILKDFLNEKIKNRAF
jgi:proteasome accessory factor C